MKVQPKLPYWIRERDLDFIDDEKLDKIESIEKETITTAKSFRRALYDHRTLIYKSKRQFVALEKANKRLNDYRKNWNRINWIVIHYGLIYPRSSPDIVLPLA